LYYIYTKKSDPKFDEYKALNASRLEEITAAATEESTQQEQLQQNNSNNYSLRVIGYAITASGLIISVIGSYASMGRYIILPVALVLLVLGGWIFWRNR